MTAGHQQKVTAAAAVLAVCALTSATFLGWAGVLSSDAVAGVIFGVLGLAGGAAASELQKNGQ